VKKLAMLIVALVALAALPATASAKFRDTPTFMMAKGLEEDPLGTGIPWKLNCSKRWVRQSEDEWASRCGLKATKGNSLGVYHYWGTGYVFLRQYFNIYLWSYQYDYRVTHPVELWEIEFWEQWRAECEYENQDHPEENEACFKIGGPKPQGTIHEHKKHPLSSERPINLH
jgi:hypothetical protein